MAEQLSFGTWLREMRKELDLTQEEMAARIGYQGDTIRKIECGLRRPSKQVAELLSDFFRVRAEDRADFVRFARFSGDGHNLFHYLHTRADGPIAGDAPPEHGYAPSATTEREAKGGDLVDGAEAGAKRGPSLAIVIPGEFTEKLHWDEHTTVEPKIAGGKLVIEAVDATER